MGNDDDRDVQAEEIQEAVRWEDTVYCWSMDDDYPLIKSKFTQDIVDVNTRAEAEEDTDKEMQAIRVGAIYSKALRAVVMEKTSVDLPAFIRQLGASLSKEVTRFNSTKLNYSTLRAAVHDAVRDYDAATKVPSLNSLLSLSWCSPPG